MTDYKLSFQLLIFNSHRLLNFQLNSDQKQAEKGPDFIISLKGLLF